MEKKKFIQVFNIILVVLSMITIFLFSSESAEVSKKTSRNVVKEVVSVVMKDEAKAIKLEKKINANMHVVRKAAHLTEFFILGFLIINLLKDYKKVSIKLLIFGIIFCLVYACSDELHQFFVSGRAARMTDIVIDTTGSIIGIGCYYLLYNRISKSKKLM